MRYTFFLLALLLATAASAQTSDHWTGTLSLHDGRGDIHGQATGIVTVAGESIDGHWTTPHSSGTLKGHVKPDGSVKATLVVYGGAEVNGTIISTERCHGQTTAKGHLTGDTLTLASDFVLLDNAQTRAQGRACQNVTHLVLTLTHLRE